MPIPRVDAPTPPRVDGGMFTSNSLAAPANIRASPRIHRHTTRRNISMTKVIEAEEPPCVSTPTKTSNKVSPANNSLSFSCRIKRTRTVNRQHIDSLWNSSIPASHKLTASLIRQQFTLEETMHQLVGITDKMKHKVNENRQIFMYNTPCPKERMMLINI
jgi:hypothetical protein